ncbi:hypothetical protein A0H81_03194 [Grifola frondosa]|uniref:Uncharacterized protein n=1 Tax=Grifola frondosa TaxID=5627 RepID=A0A1C7MKE1_GRIFR|nr:hypothetical protein A0H81_03194 [Grifola frondosa]
MAVFATIDAAFGLRHNLDAFCLVHWVRSDISIISPHAAARSSNTYADCRLHRADLYRRWYAVYRCYIVYGRKWWIAFPSALLWARGTVCGAIIIIIIFTTLDTDAFLNASRLVLLINCTLELTFALNILTTTMIVYRIWRVSKQTVRFIANSGSHSSSGTRLETMMRLVVESGLLYTLSAIVFAGTYIASNNAQYGISDNAVQIIGIVFNLVIIHVDKGTATDTMTFLQVSSLRATAQGSIPLQLMKTQASAPGSIPKLTDGISVDADVSHAVDYGRNS